MTPLLCFNVVLVTNTNRQHREVHSSHGPTYFHIRPRVELSAKWLFPQDWTLMSPHILLIIQLATRNCDMERTATAMELCEWPYRNSFIAVITQQHMATRSASILTWTQWCRWCSAPCRLEEEFVIWSWCRRQLTDYSWRALCGIFNANGTETSTSIRRTTHTFINCPAYETPGW